MSYNISICNIFLFILKVASMIATIFSLNGGLLTQFFVYTFVLFVCLFVFYVPSTVRSFRDGSPIYCPLRRT